jgi:murein DD-endopeptidase MepM/ murein hydrolase activator NlpD
MLQTPVEPSGWACRSLLNRKSLRREKSRRGPFGRRGIGMLGKSISADQGLWSRARNFFRSREIFVHDGATMRRLHVSSRVQVIGLGIVSTALAFSILGTAQLTGAAPIVMKAVSREAAVVELQQRLSLMRSEIVAIRKEATAHAVRLEQRQAFLDAVLTGKGTPALPAQAQKVSARAADVISPYRAVEAKQIAMVARAKSAVEVRYSQTAATLAAYGIPAQRIVEDKSAMGGPYEPLDATAVKSAPDPAFRALFQSWKRLDQLQQGIVAIPSQKPVDLIDFTSGFGVRSDPFRGGAAMHAGVDIRGPLGTPIYATADGMVGRAERAAGYGNLVELDHGRGIQTRYGHLSAILVQPGQRVKRGQLIARMGSTGRSTGNHLHYEVRLDGSAVNPMPFLQSSNYLTAMQARGNSAVGGPAQPIK